MQAALSLSNVTPGTTDLVVSPSLVANDFELPARKADLARRDRLVEEYVPFVRVIASRLRRTLGASVDVEDLVSYGFKGLIQAAERFDENHGVSFKTFSYYRIRGAMIDALRTHFWYTRGDYQRFRSQEQAHELLQHHADQELRAVGHDDQQDEDAAAALGVLGDILSQLAAIHVTSLEAAAQLPDDRIDAADAVVERGDESFRVRSAVASLPEKERRLIELYYFEDKTLEQAGAELGLSKSWTCRLHARAVRLLRDALEAE